KLLAWVSANPSRRLVVIAYDDRNITLNGKLVVGQDGGTFRATERMRARFSKATPLAETKQPDFVNWIGLKGQVAFHLHQNPQNKILQPALVGEMNGLLRGLPELEAKPSWGTFGGPRAYPDYTQAAPALPRRPTDAPGGAEFFRSIATLTRQDREESI